MYSEAITVEQVDITTAPWQPVIQANAACREEVIAVVTMGFSTDPIARWVYRRASDYFKHFPGFVRAFGGRAIDAGSADTTGDVTGAALWLPPGVKPDEEALVQLVEMTVEGKTRHDLFAMFDQMAASHPVEPHWYLPMIAVDTFSQNCGIGSLLMNHAVARCDGAGMPAYLESSNPRNIPLYRRFGFEVVGEIQSGDSPPMYPMLRPANAGAAPETIS